jgi:hypothetical protein
MTRATVIYWDVYNAIFKIFDGDSSKLFHPFKL